MLRPTFRLLITAAFLSLSAHPALAQGSVPRASSMQAQVHGQVRYAHGGGPAFNILVQIEKYSGGVVGQETTDRNGRFRFVSLTREQFIVKINTPGFKNVQQWVELNTNLNQYLMFTLEPEGSGGAPGTANPAGLINANVPLKAQEEFTKGRAALIDGGKIEEGIRHLETAIQISPNFLEALSMLGAAYMDSHQLDKAESMLRRALKINAKKADLYFALGEVYRLRKEYAEAEKTLLAGLKIDNKSWRGHLVLGRVYWDMDKIVQAGPHVGTALRLKPDLAEGHLLGGDILLRARQPENAIAEFEEYLRLEPNGKYAAQTRELVTKIKMALAERKR